MLQIEIQENMRIERRENDWKHLTQVDASRIRVGEKLGEKENGYELWVIGPVLNERSRRKKSSLTVVWTRELVRHDQLGLNGGLESSLRPSFIGPGRLVEILPGK